MYTINWLVWNLQDYKDFFASVSKQTLTNVFTSVAKDCIETCLELTSLNNLDVSNINLDCNLNEIKNEELLRKSKNERLQRIIANLDRQEKQMYIPAPLGIEVNNQYLLIDGNHRFAVAKALQLPIKMQLINNSAFGKCFLTNKKIDNYMSLLLAAYKNLLEVSSTSS